MKNLMAQRKVRDGDDVYIATSKHMTGIPVELVDAVRSIHDQRRSSEGKRCRIGDIYVEAISRLMDTFESRLFDLVIESQAIGNDGVSVVFYGRDEVIRRFEKFCQDLSRRESPVFVTALRGYVASEGYAV